MQFKVSIPRMEQIDLDKKAYRGVVLRSLIKVSRSAEVQANRMIREEYNMRRSDVDKLINLRPASISNLSAVLVVRGKRLPVMLLQPRQTKQGVTIAITRGTRKLIRHAFLAKMKSSYESVFQRKTKKRLHIKELRTISAAEMFGKQINMVILDKFVADKFPGLLEHELQYYLTSGKGFSENISQAIE